jgi:hypothetical protein
MLRWCTSLAEEIVTWPKVMGKPMFGMTGFYRGERIFAAVPKTRAADTERSILIKLPGVRSPRLSGASGPGSGWVTFELHDEGDVSEALEWIGKAYEIAGRRP